MAAKVVLYVKYTSYHLTTKCVIKTYRTSSAYSYVLHVIKGDFESWKLQPDFPPKKKYKKCTRVIPGLYNWGKYFDQNSIVINSACTRDATL